MTPVQIPLHNAPRFAGYAALFNVADAAKDIIKPGAFKHSLSKHGKRLPIFWQHRPEQVVGFVESVSEDARGLRIIGQAVNGLSFGYRATRYRKTPSGRVLDEVDLFEISLVTHPLQHGARVHLVL